MALLSRLCGDALRRCVSAEGWRELLPSGAACCAAGLLSPSQLGMPPRQRCSLPRSRSPQTLFERTNSRLLLPRFVGILVPVPLVFHKAAPEHLLQLPNMLAQRFGLRCGSGAASLSRQSQQQGCRRAAAPPLPPCRASGAGSSSAEQEQPSTSAAQQPSSSSTSSSSSNTYEFTYRGSDGRLKATFEQAFKNVGSTNSGGGGESGNGPAAGSNQAPWALSYQMSER